MCPDCAHQVGRPPGKAPHAQLLAADAAVDRQYRERDEQSLYQCSACSSVLSNHPVTGWILAHRN